MRFVTKPAFSSVSDILIVCTKDRSSQVQDRLNEFRCFTHLPSAILVVDSSVDAKTKNIVDIASLDFPTSLFYLHSKPGLPLQRNFGINWIFETISKPEIIHFLDDDIVPDQDYFLNLRDLFASRPNAIAIGGFDKNLGTDTHTGLIRLMLGLGSRKHGIILKSGIAIPPLPETELQKCQWLVGGTQSFRANLFEWHLFDPNLRMYGEDLDFYLRIAKLGDVFCSSKLPITHLNDPTNRDTIREINLYHNGVRWLFASRYPSNVNRFRVLVVALALGVGEFGRFLSSRNKDSLRASAGNFEFLFRLLAKKKVLQVT
jgi:GT2 family glycosyltransferase